MLKTVISFLFPLKYNSLFGGRGGSNLVRTGRNLKHELFKRLFFSLEKMDSPVSWLTLMRIIE